MKRKSVPKMIIGFLVFAVALLLLILIVFPPSKGKIPQIYDEKGEDIVNSIAEKYYLETEAGKLGMVILAKDISSPVLLVCGGSPGIPQYLIEYLYPSTLTDQFVVCYLEYRGTGLSYSSDIKAEEMTTEKYISDVVTVSQYLSQRFQQEKIYIMGHSFGTYIALKAVQQYPAYYHGYFAMSQICDQKESEYRAYDYMKEQYAQLGNSKMVEKFEAFPIRESDEMFTKYFSSSLRDRAMHELGVGTTRTMDSVVTGIFFPSLGCKAYTWQERINLWRGKANAVQFPVVMDSIWFDAVNEVPSLQLPIYFFAGKYDYTCSFDLQYGYYEQLRAPIKEFYVFENSAHSPIYEEPQKAHALFDKILAAQ